MHRLRLRVFWVLVVGISSQSFSMASSVLYRMRYLVDRFRDVSQHVQSEEHSRGMNRLARIAGHLFPRPLEAQIQEENVLDDVNVNVTIVAECPQVAQVQQNDVLNGANVDDAVDAVQFQADEAYKEDVLNNEAVAYGIRHLFDKQQSDVLEKDVVVCGIRHLFDEQQSDVLEQDDVAYGIRHLFDKQQSDILEQDDVAYALRHLFDWRSGRRNRDVLENPSINYAIRHLFEINEEDMGLSVLFGDDAAEADEIDEDAPEFRAIDYAIRHLRQGNANSWKSLVLARLTASKKATITAVATVTALIATGVYKYVHTIWQGKKAEKKMPNQCTEVLTSA